MGQVGGVKDDLALFPDGRSLAEVDHGGRQHADAGMAMVVVISGTQMRAYLENELELVYSKDPLKLSGGWGIRPSGMTILFTAGAPAGRRIKDVKIAGKEIQADGSYTIGGCEQDGEAFDRICRLSGVSDARYVPGTVHAALKAYLKAHSPIDPKREGRVRATDLPATVWSQYGALQTLWHIPGDAAGVAIPGGRAQE